MYRFIISFDIPRPRVITKTDHELGNSALPVQAKYCIVDICGIFFYEFLYQAVTTAAAVHHSYRPSSHPNQISSYLCQEVVLYPGRAV